MSRQSGGMKYGMTIRFWLIACACLGWLGLSVQVRADDASTWLKRMQRAALEQNYQGTFIFVRGDMSSTQQIFHRYANGIEHERLLQVDGTMGEVVRKSGEVTCILPENKAVQLEQFNGPGKPAAAFVHVMPDPQFYALKPGKVERIANRICQQIRIEALDEYRYSYSLWLDQETGLLLKSLINDLDGAVLERFQFTSIEFPEQINDEDLMPESAGQVVEHEVIPVPPRDRHWPDRMMWDMKWLPPGFATSRERSRPDQNLMVFSDGMTAFSVFIEAVSGDQMPEGASRVGATTAYSQTLGVDPHRYVVTVMGEIPPMSAMKVAEAVRPQMME